MILHLLSCRFPLYSFPFMFYLSSTVLFIDFSVSLLFHVQYVQVFRIFISFVMLENTWAFIFFTFIYQLTFSVSVWKRVFTPSSCLPSRINIELYLFLSLELSINFNFHSLHFCNILFLYVWLGEYRRFDMAFRVPLFFWETPECVGCFWKHLNWK